MHSLTRSPRPPLEVRTTLNRLLRHSSGLFILALLACSGTTEGGRCADGRLACADECVDEMSSLLHCGACGNFCQVGQDCVSGACACLPGQTPCSSGCVDLAEDALNCGSCGVVCGAGEVCSAGVCSSGCGAGLLQCGSSCANPVDSVQYCGSCEAGCDAGQVCQAGLCACTQGRDDCGSGCTDLREDPLNCGQCGVVCPVGSTCSEGACGAVLGTGGAGSGGAPGSGGQGVGGAPASGGAVGSGGVGTGGGSSGGAPGTGGSASGGSASGGQSSGGSGGSSSGGGSGSGGSPGCTETGFYVEAGRLYDANCNEFIMRGINYPYAWFAQDTNQADFDAMAAAGANSVRIVLATGARWTRTDGATLSTVIGWAKAAQLISVLEVHDTTGYAEQSGSVALSNAQSYWTASDIVNALQGQEAYVLVNIGNEPNGNDTTSSWAPSHVTAVQALRNAGLTHTLVIDAPNWGQDWEGTMMNGDGNAIWDADSLKNLVFSVHMYQEFSMASDVTTYVNTFLSEYEAPLIIGEFAADHGSQGDVAEATIMSTAESLGLGYLGWSWSGNGSGLETLDITQNFDASSLTAWGNTLINGANGLQETGEVCSIFQ